MLCDRVHTDLVRLSTSMIEVGLKLKVVLERWTENRRGWCLMKYVVVYNEEDRQLMSIRR